MFRVLVFLMMFSSVAMAKSTGTIAVLYSKDGKLNRVVYDVGPNKINFSVGNQNISCEAILSTLIAPHHIEILCQDMKSEVQYSILTDCDRGESALQINTNKNKKTLPQITVNASCKTVEEKI